MQNEGCGKYLDIQSVIGRIELLRAFEFHERAEHALNTDMSRTFGVTKGVCY